MHSPENTADYMKKAPNHIVAGSGSHSSAAVAASSKKGSSLQTLVVSAQRCILFALITVE